LVVGAWSLAKPFAASFFLDSNWLPAAKTNTEFASWWSETAAAIFDGFAWPTTND